MAEAFGDYFPQNITVEECRQAIHKAPGFRETVKGDYRLFNYDYAFSGSFPDPNLAATPTEKRILQIRRECRGIIFHKDTGEILTRRFHKFFNIYELPETQPDRIDLSRPHVLMNKMDGCLVGPFISNGEVRFGSKMGVTDVASTLETDFIANSPIPYAKFSREWIEKGYTPLYEWCSYKQQIVIEYERDMLILIGIRHNQTGRYLLYKEMVEAANAHGVPVTELMNVEYGKDYTNAAELVQRVKAAEGLEGYVLAFENGEMYKMKCNWYMERSKKMAGSFTGQEKELWNIILENKIDDLSEALGERRKKLLEEYGQKLWAALERSAGKMQAVVDEAKGRGVSRKDFAAEIVERSKDRENNPDVLPSEYAAAYFKVMDGERPLDVVLHYVKLALPNRTRLDIARKAFAEGLKINLS